MFSKKSNLVRHFNTCKIKINDEMIKEDIFRKLLLEFEQLKKENDEIKKDNKIIKVLQNEINILKLKPNVAIDKQQNIDKQINNNNNIKLIAFGKEDMDFVTDNVCKSLLKKGFQSLPALIEYKHFNKEKPEYHKLLEKRV